MLYLMGCLFVLGYLSYTAFDSGVKIKWYKMLIMAFFSWFMIGGIVAELTSKRAKKKSEV